MPHFFDGKASSYRGHYVVRCGAGWFVDEQGPIEGDCVIVDPHDMTRRKRFPAGTPWEDLLVPVFRGGRLVYNPPPLDEAQSRARSQLAAFHAGVRRFDNPHRYPVGLEAGLFDRKTQIIMTARGLQE